MDTWVSSKKQGEMFFKERKFGKACDCYIKALSDIELKLNKTKPELEVEASKISSNISLMYLKLLKEAKNDNSLSNQSKSYAKKAINYNPTWIKGYLRLVDVCKHNNDMNDALNAIALYMQENKDIPLDDDFQSLLADVKYYTHKQIMLLSPSWSLIKYPSNVRVIDPLGGGHYKSLKQLLEYHGKSLKHISLLVRPGVYIGNYFLSDSDIDIVGDCEVEIDSSTNAINKDPSVVFKNSELSLPILTWTMQKFEKNERNVDPPCTFYFKNSKVSLKRISVYDEIMHHPVHTISTINTEIKLFECSFVSKCSIGLTCSDHSTLICLRCRCVGSHGAVTTGNNTNVSLTDCLITDCGGNGVECRDKTETVTLKRCTITKCKNQGLVVLTKSKAVNVYDCYFESNCSEMTINEGCIQIEDCRVLIKNTTIKNVKCHAIIIEGGSGYFENLLIENCLNGMSVSAAKVQIIKCTFYNCIISGVFITQLKGSVLLDDNKITKCGYEIHRSEDSCMPTFKGKKKNKIETVREKGDSLLSFDRMMRQNKNAPKSFDIGPVGDVLKINDKPNMFYSPPSQNCEGCGVSEFLLKRKLKACGECKIVFYCSPECQQRKWKLHRSSCQYAIKSKQNRKESPVGKDSEKVKELQVRFQKFCENSITQQIEKGAIDSSSVNEPNGPKWKRKNQKKKKKGKASF